jgi:MFS-type transporter involved in bile tolerance (Atg22 family)
VKFRPCRSPAEACRAGDLRPCQFAGLVATITASTRLRLLVPDELRGRVMSIYVLLMQGTTPLGAFVLGVIAGHFGTGDALVAFGAATAATVGVIWLRGHRAAGTERKGDAR